MDKKEVVLAKGLPVMGFNVPWNWVDGLICGVIEKGEDTINAFAEIGVDKLDNSLQSFVDSTSFEFDNVGKTKVQKAVTLAMVKKFMPELLNP